MIHCTAVNQSCGSEALNVTLEKNDTDDIDGNTPMLRGQGIVYVGRSCCDIIFQWKNNVTTASCVEFFHLPVLHCRKKER